MRFKPKEDLRHRLGERRIVRKFLFLPRQFGHSEVRQFEFAHIVEQVCVTKYEDLVLFNGDPIKWEWVEIDFADAVK